MLAQLQPGGFRPVGLDGDNCLHACLDHAATLLIAVAPDGTVRQANASAVRWVDGAELVGRAAWDSALVEGMPASAADLRAAIASAAAGGQATLDIVRRPAVGGATIAELTVAAIDGGVLVLVEGRDVTAARGRERQHRELLRTASGELRSATTGLRNALALAAVAASQAASLRGRDLVRMAEGHADRLTRCVTDLLDLEQIHTGAVAITTLPTPAAGILRAAADAVAQLAERRGVRVVVRPGFVGRVVADEDRTGQALAFLLTRLIGATTSGGTLRLAAERTSGGRVRLTVDDPHGAVKPTERARLAGLVDQVVGDGPRRDDDRGDAVLGLAIVRALVERQGGSLGATAQADRLLLCWIELPAATAAGGLVLVD